MPASRRPRGFTLIELMLVVAIIGLLAAIALPKFAELVVKAREASVKGGLGAIRSALSIYYADNEGQNPNYVVIGESLTTGGKYLNEIPVMRSPQGYHDSSKIVNRAASPPPSVMDGSGGWFYLGFPNWYAEGPQSLVVACTHTDSKGSLWSTY
ncbi:MAG TPA: type II secretion system protein [Elusimicrobiota bacterium]|nr:type II secretion system protein [Elusimicrobiota bacterium]HNG46027.1 type II secretion system protein [Elusimicrobiota bacterium]